MWTGDAHAVARRELIDLAREIVQRDPEVQQGCPRYPAGPRRPQMDAWGEPCGSQGDLDPVEGPWIPWDP